MESAPDALLRLDELPSSGKHSRTRLRDAAAGRSLVRRLLQEDEPRSHERARVKGMIDGNPPYSSARQRAEGRGWESNLNFLEGEGIVESAKTPYYQLLNGVETYAETRTAWEPENPNHEQWHGTIAERFHRLLKRWRPFDWHMKMHQYQMLLHGIGPVIFDRDGDWRFRAVAAGMVLAPAESASCVDERLPFLALRIQYRVHELYAKIRDEKTAKALGYDVARMKDAIRYGARGLAGNDWSTTPWESFQSKLKNNDFVHGYVGCETIGCAHLFVQEFDGKISHFLLTESEVPSDDRDGKAPDGFLYRHPNRFDSISQALVVFFQTIGDGSWHSVRGLATKCFKHLEASNRLKNQALNNAFLEASLKLQPATKNGADKLRLTQVGSFTILPAGVEVKQMNLSGALDGILAVDRLLSNHLANNIGMFQQRTLSRDDGRGAPPTATQVQAQVAKESTLTQGQITEYFSTLDTLYAEVFRRAADPRTSDEEARRFQRECVEAGVPREALTHMESVRASRAAGYGSAQMRKLIHQEMLQSGALAAMPQEGQDHFWRSFTGATFGADKVELFFPKQPRITQDDWMAQMENAAIAEGKPPPLISGQNDVAHLHIHLQDAAETLAPIHEAMTAGQADPAALESALRYLAVMGPHVEAHLARLQRDPADRELAQMFAAQARNLAIFLNKLQHALKPPEGEQPAPPTPFSA